MLELKNININLSISDRKLIENFNFTLNQGDKAVIIGEEGNGKSTLLKFIYDEHYVSDYCQYTGQIIKKGRLSYLPQMFPEEYLDDSLKKYFKEVDMFFYTDILTRLDLTPQFISSTQIIKTLSGGEKIKIQLAKILMSEPDILLLDEPTNDIDIETLIWLEEFINNYKMPILFVSHDETLIENTANIIIHVEQLVRKTKCRITIANCNYSEYIKSRTLAFNKQMQVAKKQRSDHESQMEKWAQIYNRVDHEQRVISRQDPGGARLLKKKMKSVKSQEKRLNRQAEDFLDIPQVEDAILTKFSADIFLPRSKIILDLCLPELIISKKLLSKNICLKIIGNEHIGIVGKNGVGKSTLLHEIWKSLEDRSDIIPYYMPQDYSEIIDFDKTPVEFLTENYSKADITKARTYMGSMKFTHEEMTKKISMLSGGQKAKMLFLDMELKNANVLILDEPTRNFSPLSNPVIRKTLAEFNGAIISVSHDRKYLDEVCEKVYELTFDGIFLRNEFYRKSIGKESNLN